MDSEDFFAFKVGIWSSVLVGLWMMALGYWFLVLIAAEFVIAYLIAWLVIELYS